MSSNRPNSPDPPAYEGKPTGSHGGARSVFLRALASPTEAAAIKAAGEESHMLASFTDVHVVVCSTCKFKSLREPGLHACIHKHLPLMSIISSRAHLLHRTRLFPPTLPRGPERALATSDITIIRRRDMPEGQRVVGVDRQYGRAMSSQWLAILKEEIVLLRVSW